MRTARCPGLALAACVLLALAASEAGAQAARRAAPALRGAVIAHDTDYVEAVIRVDLESGPNAVVSALASDSTLLLPLRPYFEMAGIRLAAFVAGDSAVAMLEPGSVALTFRPRAHTLTRGALAVTHDTLDVVWWDGELYVATGLLDRLLGTRTAMEWRTLSAMVGSTAGLPVIQAARRERRRVLLGARGAAPGVLEVPLRERTLDGLVGTWAVNASTSGPNDQLGLDLGLGGALFGGSAELRQVAWDNRGAGGSELRASWSRVFASPWARQLRLGDVQTSGRRARLLRGVVVTSAPFVRGVEFDAEDVAGRAPPGWEVELYDRGRLLAFTAADQLGAFRVPLALRYGQNPFELVLYGPAGETVRQRHTIRVPFSRLPARSTEYTLAAGACRYDPCRGLFSGDARYGLSRHVTLQGGWDGFFEDGGTLWQPYGLVSAAPLPDLGITGEAVVNGHLRLSADYEPSMDLRVNGGVTHNAAGGARYGARQGELTQSDASLYWRPGWMDGMLFFQGSGLVSSGPDYRHRLLRLAATTRVSMVRYSLGILADAQVVGGRRDPGRFAIDAGADVIMRGPWRWLARSVGTGQIAIEPAHGLTAIRATIGRLVTRGVRVDAGVGWFRNGGASLELGFTTSGAGPRMGTRSRLSDSGTDGLMFASGSVALDPRTGQLSLSEPAGLGRAGVSGIMFRDDNANGVRDAGEPGLAGIPIHIGGRLAETDQDGRFVAWGLYPSVPARIVVDSMAFESPQLMLPAPVIVVRPVPNAFGTVAVPVVVGAEVSGYVLLGDVAVSGVAVVLRELNTGAEFSTTTFVDGLFYRGAVPPGEYEVTLPEAVLDRLGALAPPVSIVIPPGAGEKRITDLNLVLERRP